MSTTEPDAEGSAPRDDHPQSSQKPVRKDAAGGTPPPPADPPKKKKNGCLWILLACVALSLILFVPACIHDDKVNKETSSTGGLDSAQAIVACGNYATKYLQPQYPALKVKANTVADSSATLSSDRSKWSVRVGIDVGNASHHAYCTVSGSKSSPSITEFHAS